MVSVVPKGDREEAASDTEARVSSYRSSRGVTEWVMATAGTPAKCHCDVHMPSCLAQRFGPMERTHSTIVAALR